MIIFKSGVMIGTIAVITALLVGGCKDAGGLKLGSEIPSGAAVSKLADIVSKPQDFNGKTVVLKGFVAGQCGSLCEFFYKEGVHQVTIWPQGYKLPKLETGKKVTVYAQVTSGEQNIAFSALGIRTE